MEGGCGRRIRGLEANEDADCETVHLDRFAVFNLPLDRVKMGCGFNSFESAQRRVRLDVLEKMR